MTGTEAELRHWRYGTTQAERLVAGILRLEKYQNIEPQSPLGGGDEGADILCERGRRFWVCAVYFPTTEKDFAAIEKKFLGDLKGAKKRKRHGIVFVTNQRLTRGERKTLSDLALAEGQECTIYDVERLRGVLDSSEGYGLRVAYLRITMSSEEQIAFFAARENGLAEQLAVNTEHMKAVIQKLEQIRFGQDSMKHSVDLIAQSQDITIEPIRGMDPLAVGDITTDGVEAPVVSTQLSVDLVRLIHRLVCFDLPTRMLGHLRTQDVYITKASRAPDDPTVTPPPPAEIFERTDALCRNWLSDASAAVSDGQRIAAIARFFHGLLVIHPFLDGNGRVARSIMMLQSLELFGHADMSLLDRGADYYFALQEADQGRFGPLEELIARIVDVETGGVPPRGRQG